MTDCLRLARRVVGCSVLVLAGAGAVVACGPGEPPPSFRLTQPPSDPDGGMAMTAEVTTQEMGGAYYVPITVEATGLMLREPGQCGGMDRCGHVVLRVDGDACNVMGQGFNARGAATTLQANLSACPMIVGPHAVRADFVRDDGTAFPMPLTSNGRILATLAGPGAYSGNWTGTVTGEYTLTEPSMMTTPAMGRTAFVVIGAQAATNPREDMRITLQSGGDEFWTVDAARNGDALTFRLTEYMGANFGIPVTYTVTAATAMLRPMRVGAMMVNQLTLTMAVSFTTRTLSGQMARGTAMYTFTGTQN